MARFRHSRASPAPRTHSRVSRDDYCTLTGWSQRTICYNNLDGQHFVGEERSSITLFHQMKVAPTSLFVNQLPASSLSRSGRSLRKPEQLLLPPAHTIKYMDSFFYHSAILWNSMPFEIQEIQNNQHFKSAVENHWRPFKFITTDDIPSLTTS